MSKPKLSAEAKEILKKIVAVDESLYAERKTGEICTGDDINMIPNKESSTVQRWFDAIDELEEQGLISKIYIPTNSAYEAIEDLPEKRNWDTKWDNPWDTK